MKRLMQEIAQWHKETFPTASAKIIIEKLKEEVFELAIEEGEGRSINEEAADVFIVLASLIQRANIPIEREVRKKMAINRKRRWLLQADGTWKRQKVVAH